MDTRFCYGASCTWFGSIHEVGSTRQSKAHQRLDDQMKEHGLPVTDHGLPCCPVCGGMLFEISEETSYWLQVDDYEAGKHPIREPHPGYRKMLEWQRDQKKCFQTVYHLARAYHAATGIEVQP